MRDPADVSMIDFKNPVSLSARRPILIAHRGGAVGDGRPENSRAAIRQAAADGYDMVELDIAMASDGEPVLFHNVDGTLGGTSAAGTSLDSLTSQELVTVKYDGSAETIISLDDGLMLCRSLGLGVMLDIKIDLDRPAGRPLVDRIGTLLVEHTLTAAAMTISAHPLVHDLLASHLLRPIGATELDQVAVGRPLRLDGRYWFGVPRQLNESLIEPMQRAGALVIPAINSFRYRGGAEDPRTRDDIRRLSAAGVDGFQIDSVFRNAFPPSP